MNNSSNQYLIPYEDLLPPQDSNDRERGAVFTKPSVVEFMLDLIGYTPDRALSRMRLLEPSFGGGNFVLCAVDRLIMSWKQQGGTDPCELENSICAIELDRTTFRQFEKKLQDHLISHGFSSPEAQKLCGKWVHLKDFLLTDDLEAFDFVIGNPPYVRLERISRDLLSIYRKKYPTMVGRADLYIAFMEHSLDYLSANGRLCFICADAWTRNRYGKGIRKKIYSDFTLSTYVDMYGLDAFELPVGAYPSITVIERKAHGFTKVARAEHLEPKYLQALARTLSSKQTASSTVSILNAMREADPWLLSTSPTIPLILELEARFPTIPNAGCRVGIGVATGADKIFVRKLDELDIEEDRKIPLAISKDIQEGKLQWSGHGLVNPWKRDGTLVDLKDFPRLATYLQPFREKLGKRHTARTDTDRKWYKTIDRINPLLTNQPKLLIPDIKDTGDSIAYDPGELYPHHNLCFITSEEWDLRALQALLRSGIAELFVAAYSVKIGGGFLRFQAQNLRRIRIPHWNDISLKDRKIMHKAGVKGQKLSTSLLERIYNLAPGSFDFLEGR